MEIDLALLKSYTEVNEDDLIGEIVRQPGYVAYVGEMLAEAKRMENCKKFILDEVKSKEANDFRVNGMEKFGLMKITDLMVEEYLDRSKLVKTAFKNYVDAKCLTDKIDSIFTAMCDKRKALEALSNLSVSGIYSSEVKVTKKV